MNESQASDGETDPVPEENQDAGTKDITNAYLNLTAGLKQGVNMKSLVDGFNEAIGGFENVLPKPILPDPVVFMPPAFDYDAFEGIEINPAPSRTAENTERMVGTLEAQHAAIAELVSLTASNLALTKDQRLSAEAAQKFSRRTTIASMVISVASLGASIAAVVIAVVVR